MNRRLARLVVSHTGTKLHIATDGPKVVEGIKRKANGVRYLSFKETLCGGFRAHRATYNEISTRSICRQCLHVYTQLNFAIWQNEKVVQSKERRSGVSRWGLSEHLHRLPPNWIEDEFKPEAPTGFTGIS